MEVEQAEVEPVLNNRADANNDGNVINKETTADGGREARMAIRKTRIEQNRLLKSKPTNDKEDTTTRRTKKVEPEHRETGRAKTQMTISHKRIQLTKDNGNELVTNIRVGITGRESNHRAEEARKVETWKIRELEEQHLSQAAESNIDKEWEKLQSISGPYELNHLLQAQRLSCNELLEIKNKLCSEYVAELKAKDDEYVRELKRQAEEIDKLLDRMESQYKAYEAALIEEMEHIEKAFVEERTEMITNNLKETERLFESRRANESKYMNERADRTEDYIKQLEQLRVNDSEEYNLVKIKLETDVQVLEQQLQQMRATYLLNMEKLEYNYQVLKKREEENGTILGAQKRKINRLADHLNVLKIKSARQEKTFQQDNTSLTDDYKHLTEQFKELQKKFRHFQMADSKKFKEVWKMNEEEAKQIMRKVLQADRIIVEQQLGLKWSPPKEDLFRNVDPLFFQESMDESGVTSLRDVEKAFEEGLDERAKHKAVDSEVDHKESLAAKFQDHKSNTKTMKKTLELLCNEAGFLVEDKLQKLLAPLHKDEQSLMKLDSIFKALGVDVVEDIERLTSFFVKDDVDHGSKADLIANDSATLIHPNEVVGAIRRFADQNRLGHVVKKIDQKDNYGQASRELEGVNEVPGHVKTKTLQKDYWSRMENVIDDKSYRTWMAVYRGMEKFNAMLTQRWQVTQKIEVTQRQNEELKALLRQYMASRVNDELQVPPTQIMLAQAGLLAEQ